MPVSVRAQGTPTGRVPSGASESDRMPAPYEDPARSVEHLEGRVAAYPDSLPLRLALAREYVALALMDSVEDGRRAALEGAVEAARAAVMIDSTLAEAQYWLAASLGLGADNEDGRAKISFAREAHEAALAALALDPALGGAHHVLGRLHAGARSLGWLNRLIARGLGLGEILGQASWESAEEHLRLAVALDSGKWIHPLDLGKLLLRVGKEDEGRALLLELARRQPRYPLDAALIQEAIRALGG